VVTISLVMARQLLFAEVTIENVVTLEIVITTTLFCRSLINKVFFFFFWQQSHFLQASKLG